MLERLMFWLSRDMTREGFLKYMLLVGVFGVLLLGGIAMFLGVPRLVIELQILGFSFVWVCLLPVGLRGLEREEHNS